MDDERQLITTPDGRRWNWLIELTRFEINMAEFAQCAAVPLVSYPERDMVTVDEELAA